MTIENENLEEVFVEKHQRMRHGTCFGNLLNVNSRPFFRSFLVCRA